MKIMEANLEELVMEDIMEWKSRKNISFINVKDLIEAYWKDYFDGQWSVRDENFECIR